MKTPLFPLNTVVFPEGELPLRIFEPRYIDMISECLRQDSGFGICLIEEGEEAGKPAKFFPMGTEVKIIDWDNTDDGLLGITVKGQRRFKVESFDIQPDNLCVGEVTFLDDDDELIPEEYLNFSALLKEIGNRYELPFLAESERFEDANWVSERLAELLPFEMSSKQALLEMDNALRRFDYMQSLLEKIDAGDLTLS
ncbi:MAG: peptidase S16 [Proteobacteria bacterium]|nr:peptidase S16 [Pseudomonadota bacterium]NOG59763.1 peptidase S16 [Pseudomonadota bacterium]